MSSILRDDPPAPAVDSAPTSPSDLASVDRAAAWRRTRAARYQEAREIQAELEGSAGDGQRRSRLGVVDSPAAGPARRSDSRPDRADAPWIVVLPFKAHGSDSDLAAFADGLGEDITTGLSRFSHLFVISRSSAMQHAEQLARRAHGGARAGRALRARGGGAQGRERRAGERPVAGRRRPARTCGRRPTTATWPGRGSSRSRTTSPIGWWRRSRTPTASWCARWRSRFATGRSRS